MDYIKKVIVLVFSLSLLVVSTLLGCKPTEAPKQEAPASAPEQVPSPVMGQSDEKIQIVNVKKYVEKEYKYHFRTPLVVLSIKNNTGRPIPSGEIECSVSFLDIDNKRAIDERNRHFLNDFVVIEPGYTSPLVRFGIKYSDRIVPLIGQVPINFRIKVKILIWLKDDKENAQISEVIFEPEEYNVLPIWEL